MKLNHVNQLALVALTAFVLSACGVPTDEVGGVGNQNGDPLPSASPSPQVDKVEQDWSNPIAGIEVGSREEAQKYVPFDLVVPRGLGTPEKILVTDPELTSLGDAVVAFLFETPEFGLVIVKEHLPDVPAVAYDSVNEDLLKYNELPTTHGTFSLVRVRNERQALLTTSEDEAEATIFWLEGGVEYIIQGPSLDAEAVMSLSERI